MKQEREGRRAEQLPKIQNPFLYAYGLFAKLAGTVLFAVIALVTVLVLLIFRLLRCKWAVFGRLSRSCIAFSCRLFICLLRLIGFMKLHIADEDKKKLKGLRSAVVVANHPSLLDLPLLLSRVPGAFLVLPPAPRFPLSLLAGVYPAASSWKDLLSGCRDALSQGGSIIIFPERRLTPRTGTNPYRRTAARLSRECACDIQPVYIGGSDKYGLGSPAAPFAYCRSGRYLYELKLLPPLLLADYAQLKDREASLAVTKKMHDEVSAEAYLSDYRIV